MTNSGIEVDEGIFARFDDFKMKKKFKFLVFKITDDKTKIVFEEAAPERKKDEEVDCEACWKELAARLDDGEPRYILYDIESKFKDGRPFRKPIFIFWCADNCGINRKMIYASTKDTIYKKFTGVTLQLQASDRDDLQYSELLAKAREGKD